MAVVLAIDPGTYWTGLAFFVDGELDSYKSTEIAPGVEVETRIHVIVKYTWEAMLAFPQPVTEIACERATGYEDIRPAPAVQVVISSLRSRARKAKIGFYTYHPNTVVAAVAPRGLRRKGWGNKELIRMGVQMLYGEAHHDLANARQDALDAIAVGVAHLNKTRLSALLA